MNDDNEYELLYLVRCRDETALGYLQQKFQPYIYKNFGQLRSLWPKFEVNEALQVGYIGLLNAVAYYRGDRQMAFHNFAIICINRQMQSCIRHYLRAARTDYMSCYSLDSLMKDNDSLYLADVMLADNSYDPAMTFSFRQLLTQAALQLKETGIDRRVLFYRMQGYSYQEIARFLDCTSKDVDNSVQRIRKKVSYLFD